MQFTVTSSMVLVGVLLSYGICRTPLTLIGFLAIPLAVLLYLHVRWGIYLLAVLIPLQLFPIAYLPGLPYSPSIARLLVLAILYVTLAKVLMHEMSEVHSNSLDLLVLVYGGCFFLSSPMTDDLDVLFRDAIPSMMALISSYYVLVLSIKDTKVLKHFVLLLLLSCSGVAGFAVFQYIQGNQAYVAYMRSPWATLFTGPYRVAVRQGWIATVAGTPYTRVGGIFMNPEQLGGLLIYPFLVTLSLALLHPSRRLRILYVTLSALCALGLLASMTRGAWLGAGCGIVVLVFLSRQHRVRLPVLVGILTIIGLIAASYWGVDPVPAGLQVRLGEIAAPGYRFRRDIRYTHYWLPSLETIRRSWLVGYGTRGETHSLYLNILLETGVLGLVAFSLIMGAAFCRLLTVFRGAKEPFRQGLALGLIAALSGWLVHSVFYTDLISNNGMLLFACLALARILWAQAMSSDSSNQIVAGSSLVSPIRGRALTIFLQVVVGLGLAVALAILQPGPLDLVSYIALFSVGLLSLASFVAGSRPRCGEQGLSSSELNR